MPKKKPKLVTRTLKAELNPALKPIAKTIGWMRNDIWHRFGALAGAKEDTRKLRSKCVPLYKHLAVDGTIRSENTMDTLNNIKAYREAAKAKVRKAIYKRTEKDNDEQIRLYNLLMENRWREDNFLHRQMRKHFRHGKIRRRNQFVVMADMHIEEVVDGKLNIIIKISRKHGEDIRLVTNSTGKGVNLQKRNLRIVIQEDHVKIHYAFDKGPVALVERRPSESTKVTALPWPPVMAI